LNAKIIKKLKNIHKRLDLVKSVIAYDIEIAYCDHGDEPDEIFWKGKIEIVKNLSRPDYEETVICFECKTAGNAVEKIDRFVSRLEWEDDYGDCPFCDHKAYGCCEHPGKDMSPDKCGGCQHLYQDVSYGEEEAYCHAVKKDQHLIHH
jgi:hypothetical protein